MTSPTVRDLETTIRVLNWLREETGRRINPNKQSPLEIHALSDKITFISLVGDIVMNERWKRRERGGEDE